MRDAWKTPIIVASARAILERCPPVLLHCQACEYSLKLKSISQAFINRPQQLSKSQSSVLGLLLLFWGLFWFGFICFGFSFGLLVAGFLASSFSLSIKKMLQPLCPGPTVRKALCFPPPLPKMILLVAHTQPSCIWGPSQEKFALRAVRSSNCTSVLKSKFL